MRYSIIAILFIIFPLAVSAQTQSFPESWLGNWKGELQWFKPVPQSRKK